MSNLTTEQIKKTKEQFRQTHPEQQPEQQAKRYITPLDAALDVPAIPRLTVASTLGTLKRGSNTDTIQSNKKQLDAVLKTFKTKLTAQPDSILDILYNQKRCPRCNARLQPTTSISGSPSTDWLECTNPSCNTYVDTYHPMLHQASVHRDPHRIIGNFGSYGTGKTKTSEKEIEKHIFITPIRQPVSQAAERMRSPGTRSSFP